LGDGSNAAVVIPLARARAEISVEMLAGLITFLPAAGAMVAFGACFVLPSRPRSRRPL
jgi:hypothetical protein